MPNKAGNSGHKVDRIIRGNLVERGCVECVIALPAQLFTCTAAPVSVWILRHSDDQRDKTLFLDARRTGEKKGSRRVLSALDVESLLAACRTRRSTDGNAPHIEATHTEWRVPSAVVSREELRHSDYSLNPLDHVERPSDGGDDHAYELVSAWERLSNTEKRPRALQDFVARAPFAGDRGGSLPRAGRSAPRGDLGSVCESQAGPSYTKLGKKQRSAEGLFPVVFLRHLKDRRVSDDADERVTDETAHRLRNFEPWDKDIVCVRSGAITQPALVRQHQIGWLMSPNVIRLRVNERHAHQVLPEYLFHYLCLDESVTWMRDRAAATAAPSLRSESLGSLRIPLPALAEQWEIAAALDGLDELDRAHLAVAVSARRARTGLAGALLGS
jgi:type I restriction enzyme M protein